MNIPPRLRSLCARILLGGYLLAVGVVQVGAEEKKPLPQDLGGLGGLGGMKDLMGVLEQMKVLPALQAKSAAGQQAFLKGDYASAKKHWNEGLQIAKDAQLEAGIAEFKGHLGNVYVSVGQYEKALENYQDTLSFVRTTTTRLPVNEATLLTNIGAIYLHRGQYADTLFYFRQALALYREVNARKEADQSNLAELLGTAMGDLLSPDRDSKGTEQFSKLLEQSRGSLDITLEDVLASGAGGGSRRGEANVLTNIGVLYSALGQYEKALEHYQQALAIHREIDKKGHAANLTNMGSAYLLMGKLDSALDKYQEAFAIHQATQDRQGQAAVLTNIGIVLRKKKQHAEALEYQNKSLVIHRAIGDRRGEAINLGGVGLAYEELGQFEKALASYRDANAILQEVDAPSVLWIVLRGLASAEAKLSRYDDAIDHYRQALDLFENTRAQVKEKTQKLSLMRENVFLYDEVISLLQDLNFQQPNKGYDRRALEVFERKQARILLEEIGKSGARRFSGLPREIVQRELDLEQEFAATQDLLNRERVRLAGPKNPETVKMLEERSEEIRRDREALQSEIRQKYPDYFALKYPRPITSEDIQAQVLRRGEIMLIFAVMDKNTALWVVSRENLELFTLPVGKVGLQEQVDSLRSALRVGDTVPEPPRGVKTFQDEASLTDITQASQQLFGQLFPERVRNLLGGAKDLVYIVPTGPLYDLPFGMLITQADSDGTGQHYLIEQNAIAYLSSASLLGILRNAEKRRQKGGQLPYLAFADPVYTRTGSAQRTELGSLRESAYNRAFDGSFRELPETRSEALEIADLLQVPHDSKALHMRERASRSELLRLNDEQRLDDYRYVLFATHGILPGEVDRINQPALVLTHPEANGSEGFLTMADIFGLEFNADLVSLSACNTARGQQVQGEGVMGLTRAFMYAGTPSVVVTLWSVQSRSAKELSVALFRQMQTSPHLAEALRSAKISMLRGESNDDYRHPRDWAPSVIFGDPAIVGSKVSGLQNLIVPQKF